MCPHSRTRPARLTDIARHSVRPLPPTAGRRPSKSGAGIAIAEATRTRALTTGRISSPGFSLLSYAGRARGNYCELRGIAVFNVVSIYTKCTLKPIFLL